jgi:hypothetical protein
MTTSTDLRINWVCPYCTSYGYKVSSEQIKKHLKKHNKLKK